MERFDQLLMCSFYLCTCCVAQLLVHQQNYAQLYQYSQLEVKSNFYAPCSTPFASKISVNLQVQRLITERWWKWHLMERIAPIKYHKMMFSPYFLWKLTIKWANISSFLNGRLFKLVQSNSVAMNCLGPLKKYHFFRHLFKT